MRKEGIVTRYNSNCLFCGRSVEATHHLIGGTSKRKQSDQDGLTIPCCNDCHNMGDLSRRIHGNPMAEAMSKIIGQLAWGKLPVKGVLWTIRKRNSTWKQVHAGDWRS